ncbi:hypothetical protein C3L33_11653, partial [Rhododendron williamsianum]
MNADSLSDDGVAVPTESCLSRARYLLLQNCVLKWNFVGMGDSSREDVKSTLRILVATDCHLGYMEKDEIRRHDSFQAFEEICSIAEQKQVDFLLLGGDLFHENKPSRSTLVKAIEILRRHCLNDQPVQFQVVSDQTVNFANSFGHVNYEDPHFNVGMPVFSIHGNHDDPAGVDNLSAVDILSACNLVNYFGKMVLGGSGVGQIALYPILIRKTPHAVQWMRPEPQEGCQVSDWFNILVLHQNRVKTNPKNAINEHFLPRFLDFIVWGHEHECLVDPQEVPGMGFHITQPGSSVATSLIDGESKPKHTIVVASCSSSITLLSYLTLHFDEFTQGNQYRPTKIPLNTVRPFEYAEVSQMVLIFKSEVMVVELSNVHEQVVLKDESDIDPNDQNSMLEHLDKVVRNMIDKASQNCSNKSDVKLPLVRVKVDYSGFMTINPQRFGQKYVGKVANPQDILIFSKASKKGRSEAKIDGSERLRPEELNQQNIEALVAENNLKMEILPVNDLDVALQNFVNKDDKMAFYSCVKYNLEETRNKIAKDADTVKFEEEDLLLKERVKERSVHSKEPQFTSTSQSLEDTRSAGGVGSAVSFSDDEDTTQFTGSMSTSRGRKGHQYLSGPLMILKKLFNSISFAIDKSASVAAAASVRSIADDEDNVDSGSSDEAWKKGVNEVDESSDDGETLRGKGIKRAAPRGNKKLWCPEKTSALEITWSFSTNTEVDAVECFCTDD